MIKRYTFTCGCELTAFKKTYNPELTCKEHGMPLATVTIECKDCGIIFKRKAWAAKNYDTKCVCDSCKQEAKKEMLFRFEEVECICPWCGKRHKKRRMDISWFEPKTVKARFYCNVCAQKLPSMELEYTSCPRKQHAPAV